MDFIKAHIINHVDRALSLRGFNFEETVMIPREKIKAIYEKHHYDNRTLQTLCDFWIITEDHQQPFAITRDNYFDITGEQDYQDPKVFQHKYLNREDLHKFVDQILQKVTVQINHWFKLHEHSTEQFIGKIKLDGSFIPPLEYNDDSVIGNPTNDVVFTLTKGEGNDRPWFPYNFGDFFYLSPVINDKRDRKLHTKSKWELTMTPLFNTWPDLVKIYDYNFVNNQLDHDTTTGKNATKVLAMSLLLRITKACKGKRPEFYQILAKVTQNQLHEVTEIISNATEEEQTIYRDVFRFDHSLG